MNRLLIVFLVAAALVFGNIASADESAVPAAALPAAVAAAPSAAAPPAASTAEPSIITNAQINSGDTAWMLASTALVLMMTVPGLALFYGGMVRKKMCWRR